MDVVVDVVVEVVEVVDVVMVDVVLVDVVVDVVEEVVEVVPCLQVPFSSPRATKASIFPFMTPALFEMPLMPVGV